MSKKKAVVLLSGGLDSSVSAYDAKHKGYELFSLSFRYGQQHQKELHAAQQIGKHLDVNEHFIFDLALDQLGGSSLYQHSSQPIHQSASIDTIGTHIPSTYVPARNTIFLSIALSYAETRNADAIYIGVTSADYSGYPDCRPAYITAFQQLANLATKQAINGRSIIIQTPLLHLSKKEIVEKGTDLSVPFELTWSCYQGKEHACGTCDSCLLRLKGFKEAHQQDPITYDKYPPWYKSSTK